MNDTTALDAIINEKLQPYREASDRAQDARQAYEAATRASSHLEAELRRLLIARSVLVDGKAYGPGDANNELHRLRMGWIER